MSEDEIVIKTRFLQLLSEIQENELPSIEKWICSGSYREDLQKIKSLKNSEKPLKKIGGSIKKMIPFEAEMPSEIIVAPIVGDQADCNKMNTCHVDEFLYDEEEVEKLIKAGKLKKYFCNNCGSRDIQELILISHSMSRKALQYIFKVLLPSDLSGKQLLDVGSRIGAVLYGAYYFSNVSSILGVEMNKECCNIQEKIIGHFAMDKNRIQVIYSDVTERKDIVENSDIIIINVLDFFVDIEKHKEMWNFFKRTIKKNTFLITNRSMAETLSGLDMLEEFMDWLNICKPFQRENEIYFDIEDYIDIYLYTIN